MLQTKLHRPPLTAEHIYRSRLIEQLNGNLYKPLSLICAPAGYGKSMLASSWIEDCNLPTAWISLSNDENDYRTFFIYLVTSIQMIFPEKLEKTESLVNAPELPDKKLISHTLINELDQIQENFIVVLDDYHLIRIESIHEFIDELLCFPPANLHLCMLTRRDPPLRIKNLRAHNRMLEIRMSNLTFTEEEIVGLFKRLHGITLKRITAESLHKRTEGWITALQLISLASKSKSNIDKDLASFTGDQYMLSDFLIEEILSSLSTDMKELLFSTALHNRFCLELIKTCSFERKNDNSGQSKTENLFDQLIESNLFLIPLDEERKWFRYHHLFQKIVLNYLGSNYNIERIKNTHQLAANWFEKEELIDEAIEQNLLAGSEEEAAKIVIKYAHSEFLKNVGHVEIWLNKLPLKVKENSPALLLLSAWHAFGQFHLEKIPPILEKAKLLLEDVEYEPLLSSEVSFFEGNFEYWTGDTESSIQTLNQALNQCDNLPEHIKCNIELVRYMALQKKGEYEMVLKDIKSRIKRPDKYTSTDLAFYHGSLTFVHLLEGRLRSALDVAVQMQMYTEKIKSNFLTNWSYYLQALINLQLFQTDKAFKFFEIISQKHYIIDTMAVFDSKVSLALIQQLNNNGHEADKLISSAINYAKDLGDPQILTMVQSAQARIDLLQGDIPSAFMWADAFNEPPNFTGIFFWQEIPWMTKVKVLIAKGTPESLRKAEEILGVLSDIATTSHLDCQLVEVNLLLSMALQKLEQKEASIEKLKEAVLNAEEYGFIRPFVEVGRSVIEPLNSLKNINVTDNFIHELASLIEKAAHQKNSSTKNDSEVSEKIILTERELETLDLISEGLRNKEIANKLFVSEGTIKKHVYNMGQKFNTNSRVDLLNKARSLGFLS